MQARRWWIAAGVAWAFAGGAWAQDDGGVRFGLSPGPDSRRVTPAPNPEPVPTPPDTFCAQFNRDEERRRAQHTGPCPHCPCACVNGHITCAPCARCVPDRVRPELSPPVPVPKPPAPRTGSDAGR
jgi:hypothetical protein